MCNCHAVTWPVDLMHCALYKAREEPLLIFPGSLETNDKALLSARQRDLDYTRSSITGSVTWSWERQENNTCKPILLPSLSRVLHVLSSPLLSWQMKIKSSERMVLLKWQGVCTVRLLGSLFDTSGTKSWFNTEPAVLAAPSGPRPLIQEFGISITTALTHRFSGTRAAGPETWKVLIQAGGENKIKFTRGSFFLIWTFFAHMLPVFCLHSSCFHISPLNETTLSSHMKFVLPSIVTLTLFYFNFTLFDLCVILSCL